MPDSSRFSAASPARGRVTTFSFGSSGKWISLRANDTDIFVMCLFAIHVVSLVKRLLLSFAYFLIGWFPFLMLSFDRSLYSLNVGPSSEMWFANFFSQAAACLVIILMGPFTEKKVWILMRLNFLICSLMHCFWHHDIMSRTLRISPGRDSLLIWQFWLFPSDSFLISCGAIKLGLHFELVLLMVWAVVGVNCPLPTDTQVDLTPFV